MEFGPRALGNRSILADPRNPAMQRDLNLKIKFRESFRPFAPSVLAERGARVLRTRPRRARTCCWWRRCAVRRRHRRRRAGCRASTGCGPCESPLPAVTHVDRSARVQTVIAARTPQFHDLIDAFRRRTGVPVLVNTSFNVRGEPIVCTPGRRLPLLHGNGDGLRSSSARACCGASDSRPGSPAARRPRASSSRTDRADARP